jgi:hypothetical protein
MTILTHCSRNWIAIWLRLRSGHRRQSARSDRYTTGTAHGRSKYKEKFQELAACQDLISGNGFPLHDPIKFRVHSRQSQRPIWLTSRKFAGVEPAVPDSSSPAAWRRLARTRLITRPSRTILPAPRGAGHLIPCTSCTDAR